jgi:hypothetical protein
MGVLVPSSGSSKKSKLEKRAISQCLKNLMQQEMTDTEKDNITGQEIKVRKTYAQKFAEHCMVNALSPDPKISAPFSRIVIEYVDGKPAVMNDTEKDDVPGVKFVLDNSVREKVKNNSLKELPDDTDGGGIKIDMGNGTEKEITNDDD